MQLIRGKSTVSTEGNNEIGWLEKERRSEDEQFGCLANFQFSTSAMVFSEFNSLVGYKTTEKEG